MNFLKKTNFKKKQPFNEISTYISSRNPVLPCVHFHGYGCHQYVFITIVLLNALQLAAGATGLFSQGVTAVVHGGFVHALGPRVDLTHSWRGGN